MWEREVRHQFAPDGGNREQALNYHLFSFEFCWQVRLAIHAAGKQVSDLVEEILLRAARFFWDAQVAREPWDYGDSDNAFVTPLFARARTLTAEWRRWMAGQESAALGYWMDDFPRLHLQIGYGPPAHALETGPWWFYQKSGLAVAESGFWFLRWDLSPLGYLRTAAHGHLDALHISIWYRGVAFIIDPGTGAYYGDKPLRNWLASRAAHNGPCPPTPEQPQRLGPFLWSEPHLEPQLLNADGVQTGILNLTGVQLRRTVTVLRPDDLQFQVEDGCILKNGQPGDFSVRWQFAPGTCVKQITPQKFMLKRCDVSIEMEISDGWTEVLLVETQIDSDRSSTAGAACEKSFAGVVSPAFRKTEWAPYLKLIARPRPGQSCVFRTTFVASPPS